MSGGGLRVADGVSLAEVRRAERAAMLAWPAAERRELGGWLVRRTPDTASRRANSAVAGAWSGSNIETAVLGVEGFYNEFHGVPRFQMSPTSQPPVLDTILAERGYAIEAPVRVMTARPARAENGPWPVRLVETPDAAWRAAFAEASPTAAEADGRIAMVERAKSQGLSVAYASVRDDADRALSIGVGVFGEPADAQGQGGWAMVFSMNTLASHRRRGMGGAIAGALLTQAVANGCDAAYLQVEADNPGAIALYEKSGFRDLYAYHYRSLFRTDDNE